MTQDQRASRSVSDEVVRAYLERNRKLQRLAWLSSALPLLVILFFVTAGIIRVKRLKQEATRLENRKIVLDNRLAVLSKQIDAYDSSTPSHLDVVHQTTHFVSGHPVTISINIAQSRPREEADRVAKIFQAHGYTVTAIYVKRPGEWTQQTTVRFFQYDRSTVAVGKELVVLMRSIGFGVRTEFDDEFVGDPTGRPPGAFEVYIGSDASYNPMNHEHQEAPLANPIVLR